PTLSELQGKICLQREALRLAHLAAQHVAQAGLLRTQRALLGFKGTGAGVSSWDVVDDIGELQPCVPAGGPGVLLRKLPLAWVRVVGVPERIQPGQRAGLDAAALLSQRPLTG